ncbi:hypothetical protein FRC12_008027 [Ceratobasidium sp. 428]|nr:hypothetical protein FRC12_008027 [Ceratobasidium sp. 428]
MSSSNSVPASHILLNAEAQFLVGKFRVHISQVKPHPHQRQLSEAWVDSLHQRFLEVGIERVAFPIKVILERSSDLDALPGKTSSTNTAAITELPSHVTTLVYHGQHRVAACKHMMEQDEHWWFAEVYQPALESSHPAEFLTLMHMSNEDEHRLSTSDSDRFLVMHRLYCMHREQVISDEVFEANRSRLARAVVKEYTRQGLNNLLASQDLAEAVARALQYQGLRAHFNASTWGKKLVKGRFYMLAACLVDEMVEQCRLLIDTHTDVSDKPFALPSSSCTWTQLEMGVKKKDHPWKELPGGANAALLRVKSRNPQFSTFLNPSGSDGWTLPHTILLPSVLTSDSVFTPFKEMCHLAQHLILITAGPEYLAKYVQCRGHSEDDDHLFGILSLVLREKFAGKSSNYPHKIVLVLWQQRQPLTTSLKQDNISDPSETSRVQYKNLVQNSRAWWELLRMFKMSKMLGMDISIPKVFAQDLPPPSDHLRQVIRNKQLASSSLELHPESSNQPSAGSGDAISNWARSPSLTVEQPRENLLAPAESSGAQPCITSNSGLAAGSERDKRRLVEVETGAVEQRPPKRRTRLEHSQHNPTATALTVSPCTLGSGVPASTHQLRVHGVVQKQLEQLSSKVPELHVAEARAFQSLLTGILELHDTAHFGRVIDALSDKIPTLIHRAERAEQVSQEAENDWELSHTATHNVAEGNT